MSQQQAQQGSNAPVGTAGALAGRGRPNPKRKPIRITVGGGRGVGNRKRRRPVATSATATATTAALPRSAACSSYVPAILRSQPRATDGASADDTTEDGGGDGNDDEYGAFPGADDADGDGDDVPCDALLALRSLVRRNAAAFCPFVSPENQSSGVGARGVPFVLKPMLHHALLSSVSSNAAAGNVDGGSFGGFGANGTGAGAAAVPTVTAEESNLILSANASTGVNVELDGLRRSNKVRMVQLHGTGHAEDDVGIVEIEDYERGVRDSLRLGLVAGRATTAVESGSDAKSPAVVLAADNAKGDGSEMRAQLAEWFVSSLLPRFTGRSVTQSSIRSSLESNPRPSRGGGDAKSTVLKSKSKCISSSSWDVKSTIDTLVRHGLLLPRSTGSSSLRESETSFWFTLPGMGPAARQIVAGRKRVLAKLRRSNYGEVRRSALEVGTVPVGAGGRASAGESLVRGSSSSSGRGAYGAGVAGGAGMPAAFHVRDLLSRGEVKLVDTPAGQFVKLAS